MPPSVFLCILILKHSHYAECSLLAVVPGEKHSRLLYAVQLLALLVMCFIRLETHSTVLISRCRHQGAHSLKVHNYSHSVCSYCNRMLCFGALGSAGQRSSMGDHYLGHSLRGTQAGVSVLMLPLLFSVPTR